MSVHLSAPLSKLHRHHGWRSAGKVRPISFPVSLPIQIHPPTAQRRGLSNCRGSAFSGMRRKRVRRQEVCPTVGGDPPRRGLAICRCESGDGTPERVCPSVAAQRKGLSICRRRGSAKRSVHLSAAPPREEVWPSDLSRSVAPVGSPQDGPSRSPTPSFSGMRYQGSDAKRSVHLSAAIPGEDVWPSDVSFLAFGA
jgi:hypothetical protein